jgi:hypothetical protein
VAGDAQRPIVFETAASASFNDGHDVVGFPEWWSVPPLDESVAPLGKLGSDPFQADCVDIRRLTVAAGGKPHTLGALSDAVHDAGQFLRIEPAHHADSLVAVINQSDHVVSRRANPKFLRAFVRAPADASAVERRSTPATQPVPFVVERPRHRSLGEEADETVRFQDGGYFRVRRLVQTGLRICLTARPLLDHRRGGATAFPIRS